MVLGGEVVRGSPRMSAFGKACLWYYFRGGECWCLAMVGFEAVAGLTVTRPSCVWVIGGVVWRNSLLKLFKVGGV